MKTKVSLKFEKSILEISGNDTRFLDCNLTVEGDNAEELADNIIQIMEKELVQYGFKFSSCPVTIEDENGNIIMYGDTISIPFEFGEMEDYKDEIRDAYRKAESDIKKK